MLHNYLSDRFQQLTLLSELRSGLHHMAMFDEGRIVRPGNRPWTAVIPTLQHLLGDSADVIAPFVAAWCLLYAATIRLDRLQDGDPVDDPLPTSPHISAQYNLIFGYYVLASGILDLLPSKHIPAHRLLNLRRLWTDMVLRMASGQQQDLESNSNSYNDLPLFDTYQQLAQAKTGAIFALAFGGTAMLLTDDTQLINTFIAVGEVYGMLLQYSDDLLDADNQPNATLTLPAVLNMARSIHPSSLPEHTPDAFGAYLYNIYYEHIKHLIEDLPIAMQRGILGLFMNTFKGKWDETGG